MGHITKIEYRANENLSEGYKLFYSEPKYHFLLPLSVDNMCSFIYYVDTKYMLSMPTLAVQFAGFCLQKDYTFILAQLSQT